MYTQRTLKYDSVQNNPTEPNYNCRNMDSLTIVELRDN